ncbi:hypothetical protein K491DRAFT_627426 [Lophiostoma macrostomum CBS 122681]|uniref:LicD/FKTN/FKRP nucleotidyltransferase domain-containing protein n=1 Tax=Lophiostoma macrostomum CBS 122681 TaxID=1314788 RepID=A0A6A6TDE4_9PLEO|nr:hypothetical protein K491DRAFT_627426 [Lophiostoma macrostomum CBS 122681]
MLLPFTFAVFTLQYLTLALPSDFSKRHVDFSEFQGLTKNARDRTRQNDPAGKYFHEATFATHYDGRFASTKLAYTPRRTHLRSLVRTYLDTMHSLHIPTWLMHGSLIGWYWNGKILPWDDDIDVQISEPSMAFLAAYYNMTVYHFTVKIPPEAAGDELDEAGRDYLLEINPNWTNNSTLDLHNVIDARWIDMTTGLFIDITTLRYNQSSEDTAEGQKLFCKDKHTYMSKSVFPLRESEYEGKPVKVPYSYAELLEEEYGKKVMTRTRWEGHYFNEELREWVIDGLP